MADRRRQARRVAEGEGLPHVGRSHPARQLFDGVAGAAGRGNAQPDEDDLAELGIDAKHLPLVRKRASEVVEVAEAGDRQGAREIANLAARELASHTGTDLEAPKPARADPSDPRALAAELMER